MSDLSAISAVVSGASALLGGALGTLIIERYRAKSQAAKEVEERTRQAADSLTKDFSILQGHIWHRNLGDSNSHLNTLNQNLSSSLPYLPKLLSSTAREAIPFFYAVLALISNATSASQVEESDAQNPIASLLSALWSLAIDSIIDINRAIEAWRAEGDENEMSAAIVSISEARKAIVNLVEPSETEGVTPS